MKSCLSLRLKQVVDQQKKKQTDFKSNAPILNQYCAVKTDYFFFYVYQVLLICFLCLFWIPVNKSDLKKIILVFSSLFTD